jgi:hypothetical protein
VRLLAPGGDEPGVLKHFRGDLEGFAGVQAEDVLGRPDLVLAQRRPVGGAGVLLVRRGPADDRPQHDQRRTAGLGLRGGQRAVNRHQVFAVADVLHVPAVGFIPPADVLSERDVGAVLDRDPVGVVDQDQITQFLGTGQRRRLATDTLLEIAVRGEHPDRMVEHAPALGSIGVQQAALTAGRHGHADGIADALAQRAGRRFHPRRVVDLRMARRPGPPRAQRLQISQLQAIAGEEELNVQGEARVAHRQNETVTAGPVRIARVVTQPLLKQQIGRGAQAHRGAGVAVAGLLHSVHRQHAHGVDRTAVKLAHSLGQSGARLGGVAGGRIARGLGRRLGTSAPRPRSRVCLVGGHRLRYSLTVWP